MAGFSQTKRPYSAADVVALRGTPLMESYASNAMAQKLWATLQMCKATGTHSRTFGALDPIQAVTMAPHLSSIYVSGWQSSSTASTSNEPGPITGIHLLLYLVLLLIRVSAKSREVTTFLN
jgi:isocitrate lyase